MADEKRFSVEEAAKGLRTGVSTLLLWQHIYREFLTSSGEEGEQPLTREDIRLFTYISECTESGLTREEIRQALRNRAGGQGPLFSRNAFRKDDDEDILSLLDDENPTPALLARLVIQQRRLADAEERKASALERRLDIEEEKTHTLAAILTTLQTSGIPMAAVPVTEAPPFIRPPEPAPVMPEAPAETAEDLTETVAPPAMEEPLDDLSALMSKPPAEESFDDLNALVEEPAAEEPLDDLNALVGEPPEGEPLDDLWKLVGEDASRQEAGMDNLWDLVETPSQKDDLDDLWALVDETPQKGIEEGIEEEQDNLWDLVDKAPPETDKQPMSDTGLDNLWAMTDEPTGASPEPAEPTPETDDLWALVDTPPDQPRQEPTPTPSPIPKKKKAAQPFPSDPGAYKDFILKDIIGMKRREGLSATQVAHRLNSESKPTFSGKGVWGARTIEGIFRIIEKAGPS